MSGLTLGEITKHKTFVVSYLKPELIFKNKTWGEARGGVFYIKIIMKWKGNIPLKK